MDPGRPGRRPHHQPGEAQLGGGVRQGLPDPDLRQRHELDHRLQHDHGHGRQPDDRRQRQRPLCARLRHAARHRLRIFAVRIPGVRQLTGRMGPSSVGPA
ncbi:hypothetical protein SBRY_11109 [Actinacidiphila bryophytorum]|uniref:Uncharacterized protein n=1 Tax=Actinacidiphila bryophytorum TaxID=1436133 RepID=A0A9W4E7E7_9ACTN|nr:hypothetical protein SBRY_11109 [Actinacidiphila bryophytorum]